MQQFILQKARLAHKEELIKERENSLRSKEDDLLHKQELLQIQANEVFTRCNISY